MDSLSTTPNSEIDPAGVDQSDTTPTDGVESTDTASADAGESAAIALDEPADKGYLGESPDKTPREHYTLAGVTAGKPTPENQR